MTDYLRAPLASKDLPAGIPFIIGNEAAERFSFYGMRAVLVIFMTQYLVDSSGAANPMNEEEAKGWFHLFVSAVYLTPLFGALISDGLLGKYRTIILLSLVYCVGHFALALDHTRLGLLLGLGLIAMGSGGIKPCVSAHLGDQFGRSNAHLLPRSFGWFYFAINLGAFASTLATPWLLSQAGPDWAFGVPGILMVIATIIFWSGRRRFVHIPPAGLGFVREVFSPQGLSVLLRLFGLYLFVAVFWSLFDQTGSAWVLQAKSMDLRLFGFEVLPAQIQAANPLLVMLLVPTFGYLIYPAIERRWHLTALRKIGFGMLLASLAFAISAWIQYQIDAGHTPSISWQLLAYLVLTSGEVMVSITCLEFSYTQAPVRMKSFVMAFFMMSIAIGNLFTSIVNFAIEGTSLLQGVDYYLFFTLLMLFTTVLYALLSRYYRERTHLQQELNQSD
ncbi:MAG: POT family MFS transporter [Candidatus Thiodiazotropha endolucinida]|nr:POT family MFS transporter [Candidatus Thiodiazotropha taylori]MCW4240312.1 POT family MFS transporter [Candidatus Thiodiazotropha taylori]